MFAYNYMVSNFQRLSKDKSSGSDAEDENEDSVSEQVL